MHCHGILNKGVCPQALIPQALHPAPLGRGGYTSLEWHTSLRPKGSRYPELVSLA